MNGMRKLFLRWGPAIGMMALIFFVSSQPKADIPQFGVWDLLVKKAAHMFGYGLLAVAVLRGVRGEAPFAGKQIVWALMWTLLYALTDEYHQTFVAGRGGTLIDVGVDALGALVGLAIRLGWARLFPRRRLFPFPNKSGSSHR
jgi:hypothetical protein